MYSLNELTPYKWSYHQIHRGHPGPSLLKSKLISCRSLIIYFNYVFGGTDNSYRSESVWTKSLCSIFGLSLVTDIPRIAEFLLHRKYSVSALSVCWRHGGSRRFPTDLDGYSLQGKAVTSNVITLILTFPLSYCILFIHTSDILTNQLERTIN